MAVTFGGGTAWKVQRVGDVVRSFQWIGTDVGSEPAMILYPAIARDSNAGAYVIGLSAAFKYDDMRYLVQQSAIAAKVMGLKGSRGEIHHIATVIHDGLLDLVLCPPEPVWHRDMDKGECVGELEIKKDGKVVIEREVFSGERAGHRG